MQKSCDKIPQNPVIGRRLPAKPKPRKLSFKEQRELEGIETQIHAVETEVARIEGLFADPEFSANTRRK